LGAIEDVWAGETLTRLTSSRGGEQLESGWLVKSQSVSNELKRRQGWGVAHKKESADVSIWNRLDWTWKPVGHVSKRDRAKTMTAEQEHNSTFSVRKC
jgi:hypothetical protein